MSAHVHSRPVAHTDRAGAPAPRPALWLPGLLGLAAAKLGLHVWVNLVTPFSIHRDELLYLAMGKYLRLFHMDFPPFIAIAARFSHALVGESLVGLRLLPALAGAAMVLMAGSIAREFGGGRTAQMLAALAVGTAPVFLRAAGLFQPVVFDQLWWTVALYGVARLAALQPERSSGSGAATRVSTADSPATRSAAGSAPTHPPAADSTGLTDLDSRPGSERVRNAWLLLGVAGGIGLLTKFSIGFIAVGIATAFLLSSQRRWLATRWPWIAAGTALLLGSPSIVGQVNLGFPVRGQMSDLQASQLVLVTPGQFIREQALLLGPAVLLAVLGVLALLLHPSMRRWRVVALACLATFLLLMMLRGKAYYVAPIYPALIAAGSVVVGNLRRGTAIAAAAAVVIVAFTIVGLPITLPVATPEATAARAQQLGITAAVTTNRGDVLALPQDFADMLGWREQVEAVAAVYHALPAEDQQRVVIAGGNYGEAGAIDFFGPRYGLPRAIAAVGSYWFFGPGDLPGDILIGLGLEVSDLEDFYREIEIVARVSNPWGVPEQRDNPIAVARGPAASLQEVWPELAGRN